MVRDQKKKGHQERRPSFYRDQKAQIDAFRGLVEHTSHGMGIADMELNPLYANQSLLEMVGAESLNELEKLGIPSFYAPQYKKRLLEEIIPEVRSCGSWQGENVLKRLDGKPVHVLENYFVINNQEEKPSLLCVVISDITEIRQAHEDLKDREERFRRLAENARDLIYRFRLEKPMGFEYVNPSSTDIIGYSPEEHYEDPELGKKLIHPDDARSLLEMESSSSIDEPVTVRWRHKDGHTVWTEQLNIPIFDEDKNLVAVEGIARDVTDRKNMEEALRLSEEKFRTIYENAPDFIALIDTEGKMLSLNRTIRDFEGDIRGLDFKAHVVEEHHSILTERLECAVLTGEPQEYECQGLGRHGEQTWFSCRMGPIVIGDTVDSVVLISQDITERKRVEAEQRKRESHLREQQRLESLGALAGGIAHDFNNLLVGILGNAELALMDVIEDSPVRDSLIAINESAQRAAELSKQMLAYSGKGRFVIETLDLSSIVREMKQIIKTSVAKRASVKFVLDREPVAVKGDSTQLRQVILTLISNASEAIEADGGTISIRTGCLVCDVSYLSTIQLGGQLDQGTYAYIEVSDTGLGIDREVLNRIFDPFFTTKFPGRGLGLAVVHGIIRGHGGAIDVRSRPGQGSRFRILFPVCSEITPMPVVSDDSESIEGFQGQGTILLVDDEHVVRDVAQKMLVNLGFEVVTARDGVEALEIFEASRKRFTCVLLDLTMPNMDGEKCFIELKKLNKNIRVILASGFAERDVAPKFSSHSFAGFLQKPYKINSLKKALANCLKG